MTRRIVWEDAARDELRSAFAHYEQHSSRVASSFLEDVDRSLLHVSTFPESSPRVDGEVRRKNLSTFPYGLFYEDLGDRLLIVAIGHFARRPGYWVERSRSR